MEQSEKSRSPREQELKAALERYWISNMRLVAVLIAIWALVGLGCGVLLADTLNRWSLPGTGYPLGFWFAQQGSILVFILLIFIYCVAMNRIDARHRADLRRIDSETEGGS